MNACESNYKQHNYNRRVKNKETNKFETICSIFELKNKAFDLAIAYKKYCKTNDVLYYQFNYYKFKD